ncbi:MAG: AraC family transcriptional regulator [Alphaproteobacteria bacterium]|nr:MAG: AraC family transcriptional regulator [Alphaproteobacteria bacterium]
MPDQVLSRYLAGLVATMDEEYGIAPERLYAAAGQDALSGKDERVPGAVADALWATAEKLAGDALLGIRVGRRVRYSSYSTLGHLLTTCDTVEEALTMATGYARFVGAGGTFELTRAGDDLVLTYRPVRANWPAAQVRSEAVLLPFVRFANWAAAGAVPALVFLKRPAPEDAAAFTEAFLAPVEFGAAENGIRWRPDALARPMADANRALKQVLKDHVAAEIDAGTSASGRVADWFRTRLALPLGLAGDAQQIEACAAALGLSVRSLQRALGDEGTSFRDLLAAARRESAQKLLKETGASVADIAEHLGYSEPAAFVRAFGRWCGMSPTRYRRGG